MTVTAADVAAQTEAERLVARARRLEQRASRLPLRSNGRRKALQAAAAVRLLARHLAVTHKLEVDLT